MNRRLRTRAAVAAAALALAVAPSVYFAAPANAAVGGTVTCDTYTSTYSVVGVWVDSSNNAHDGWASWSRVSGQPWKATFSKGDVNESYNVHVGCGGTTSNWNQTAYSGWVTGYQDFICHVSSVANQRVCNS